MIFRPTYPWNKNTYPYPWYIDPQYFVPQPMLFCLSTHGISTPTHGIKTHLPIMYWPSYPWYIDPPAHGLLTHLPMVYWPPYPWHIIDPHTNLILTPIHSNLPTNHGISTLLPMVVSPLYMWKVNGRRTPSDGKSSHFHWQGELKTWCKKKYSYNVLKFIFDMGANQDLISVLICIKPDIWKVRM
jgi:hypothetical protein